MAEEVGGCGKVGVLATAKSAAVERSTSTEEGGREAGQASRVPYICPDAGKHFARGMEDFNRYLSEEACKLGREVDAVVVSQVSMCGLEDTQRCGWAQSSRRCRSR